MSAAESRTPELAALEYELRRVRRDDDVTSVSVLRAIGRLTEELATLSRRVDEIEDDMNRSLRAAFDAIGP